MDLESIIREILEQHAFCKLCPEGGKKSICFQDLQGPDNDWGDHYYEFEEKDIKLSNWISCDGSDDIRVFYNKKLVYQHDSYNGEDEGVIVYERGTWEDRLRELYDRISAE